jgi:hypothetical protein
METDIIQKIKSITPTTKTELQMAAVNIIQDLQDGNVNAMELLKNFKMIEKLQELVKDQLIKSVLNETSKYKETEIEYAGVTFKKAEVGTVYDFSGCNDETYNNILEQEKILKVEKEKRAKFLKAIDGKLTQLDEDSGEFVDIFPPVKTSSSSVQVLIK